jgi:succinoglycan biosynthesis protein ExoA
MTGVHPSGRAKLPPLPARPRVSVVVPARQSAATLPGVLDAVLEQEPPVDEVVVALGPSTDATWAQARAVAARDARVRMIDNPSGRTPDGLNAAIAASVGDVVVRVDAHAVIPAGYVSTALEGLRRTSVANVGGRQVPQATSRRGEAVAAAMGSPLGAGGASYRTGTVPGPVDTVYLGAFRREALNAVGGYDARFTRNQDAELNLRLRAAGFEVWFDPRLEVAYKPRETFRGLATQYFQYGRWRRFTARCHPGSLRPRQAAAPLLVLTLSGSLAGSVLLHRAVAPVAFGGYGIGLLAASARATTNRSKAVPVAAALAVMHISWGVGFLVGPPRSASLPLDGTAEQH